MTGYEENLKNLIDKGICEETFIFDLLRAYDFPSATITRLQKGDYNLSKEKGEVFLRKKIFCKKIGTELDIHESIDSLKKELKNRKEYPRFIIVTNFKDFLSIDTKYDNSLDIPIENLPKHYDFFLPLAGMEKLQIERESIADRKAAEKLAKLYDLIIESNSPNNKKKGFSDKEMHYLNVFLSRLLFCFFSEDTGIFDENYFTKSIHDHTKEDGSDLRDYLSRVFEALNSKNRKKYPQFMKSFPYVNGGLFKENIPVPQFNKKSRKSIIECGSLNWKDINPDIFGSMIQAVVHRSQRGNLGIHYTSIENIMKVIRPLFLDEFYKKFEKIRQLKDNKERKKRLNNFLISFRKIKIFDPACGSGNFLIISYKELCKLEIKILEEISQDLAIKPALDIMSGIRLEQFYGIEIDDFAHETAKLSLYLAEHQMNLEFNTVFGHVRPTLPLNEGGNIICGNATRLNWDEVCSKDKDSEIYILGNPPYLGSKLQNRKQKEDLKIVASDKIHGFKNLDYISCWFIKATDYIIGTEYKLAFVSTNSICQGEQVSLLWSYLLEKEIEINFAYQSFKWTNNARGNAGVTCVIVGIRNRRDGEKYLFKRRERQKVKNINPYLISFRNILVKKRNRVSSNLPVMLFGSMPRDDGNLILTPKERESLLKESSYSEKFILKYIGSEEVINGKERYCLWIEDGDINKAISIREINKRLDNIKIFRQNSKNPSTKKFANQPHRFVERRFQKSKSIIIPRVFSERKVYIPINYLDRNTVISDSAQAIYEPPNHLFSILTSRMHMVWIRTVGGRLKTDYRYSSTLCYNTFPFPKIKEAQEKKLEELGFKVLDARENHSEMTLAQLYDPDKMPEDLRKAHKELDYFVEQCYRKEPFKDDEDRLKYLFKLYEEMLETEKSKKEIKKHAKSS